MLQIADRKGLLKGKTVAVDATTLEANAAMKTIRRKDTGDDWKEYLKKLAAEAGIENPREELDLIEVHDCFSVTELVTMEDLYVSPEGGAIKDVLDGFYDADGKVPCQIDGGLKCFGHPIGASGMRMIYEIYLQMQGKAGARQRQELPRYGLTHNLGGFPHQNVCSISVIGRYGA